MARVLRTLMLLVSFAALQLTLASGGPACPIPTSALASEMRGVGMASMDMSGMDMSGMGMAGMDMAEMDRGGPATASSDRAAGEASPAPDDVPCDATTTPVTCPTMAPCVFAALPPLAQIAAAPAVAAPSGPTALRVLMPLSEGAAPELPPPRA